MKKPRNGKPGPEPERLKIPGDWHEAVRKALKKRKPADGWPDQQTKGDSDGRG